MPVGVWAVVVAGLMVSRLPTLSFKTVRVPSRLVAPLLVLVGLAAAVLVTVPFLGLGIVALVYLRDDPVHDPPPPLARRAPGGVERADAGAAGVGALRPLGAAAGAAVAVAASGGGAGERHGPRGPAFR